MSNGFQSILSYCEHEYAIVSVMFYEGFLILSDVCGILVQFDFNVTLDRIRLHSETEYSVFLSQFLYEPLNREAVITSIIRLEKRLLLIPSQNMKSLSREKPGKNNS